MRQLFLLSFAIASFRTTDFDGTTNIGLSIASIIVYTTSADDPYYRYP
jgi:hypothetical protein